MKYGVHERTSKLMC